MRVAYTRPGTTAWQAQGRLQGNLDVPLTEEGAAEVETLAGEFAALAPEALYYDPGQTGRQTAGLLAPALGLRPRERKELRAVDMGLWQGLLVSDLKRKHSKAFRHWEDNPMEICPPGGEPLSGVVDRVQDFINFLDRRHQDGTVVVVCPRIVGRILRSLLENGDVREYLGGAEHRSCERWLVTAGGPVAGR